ncbi:MAG: rod shape-determining protein MreC [Anaerolineaceae bacterium]|nr:MAG: rod shape-determining protein MreC [Anaerolineaceae bacterium]
MRRSTSRTFVAVTLILIAAGLLTLSLGGYLTPVQSLILRPISSIQSWIALRVAAIRDFLTSPRDVASLREEIAMLEGEVSRLQQEIIALREQAAEAEILAALLDYARARPESSYKAARVIGRDVSPFLRSLIIDVGSDDGISRGMPVVTRRGLVGRIIEVFPTVARVQLITDPEASVNVQLQLSRADGVLAAQLNGELWVELIDQSATITQGELVITSGLGGKYPSEIPLGQVISIHRRDYELFQQAVIQSSVDFEDIDIVLVITNFRPLPIEQPLP